MNKQKIVTTLVLLLMYAVTYVIIACTWVGAEYLFEGTVHLGQVDRFFVVVGAYHITRAIYHFDSKYVRKFKRGSYEK